MISMPNTALCCTPEVIFREVEGAHLLYHKGTDMIFSLNATGSRVWRMLQESVPADRIVDTLAKESAIDPLVCERDLMSFLKKLAGHALITGAE